MNERHIASILVALGKATSPKMIAKMAIELVGEAPKQPKPPEPHLPNNVVRFRPKST
jgi:hypothetical protein